MALHFLLSLNSLATGENILSLIFSNAWSHIENIEKPMVLAFIPVKHTYL